MSEVAPTLTDLKKLPMEQKCRLLLARLAKIGEHDMNALNKHNLMMPGDPYALAYGYSDAEKMPVREHLMGAPWTRLVNEGYLVDLNGQGFHKLTEEGKQYLDQEELPAPPAPNPARVSKSATGAPRALLSYSWDGPEHQQWVAKFAERLHGESGVEIIFDRWHLNPGDDKLHFMEQAVADSNFVIVVCTPTYAKRANKREGGVGYESMVITAEQAEHILTNKFIPVLRKGTWTSSLPIYLKSRMGVNLGDEPYHEDEYERLLRVLHGEPIQPPPLGSKPDFSRKPVSKVRPSAVSDATGTLPGDGVSETKRRTLGDELTHAERELLDGAVNDPAGQISHRRPIGSDILTANGHSFIEQGDPRSAAKWLGALESLERKGLIRSTSSEKQFYAVTQQGYALAEELGPFVRWSTSEIVLEALYLNRSPETMTLACTGVMEVPATFYPDEHAADGGLMRSVKRHRALLVEGITPQVLDSLSFELTDTHFVDATTNETRDFRVSRVTSGDRKTLLLEINE
jgi:hypothetical protein